MTQKKKQQQKQKTQITTEAITTEMLDTGMPSLDNNAIDTDSPVKRDELQEDQDTPSPTTTTIEKLDDKLYQPLARILQI